MAAKRARRSGARDSGIAETAEARKSVEIVAQPIEEELEEEDVEVGGAVRDDDGGDIPIEEDDQEIPAVEVVVAARDKGKQRAISPDLPVEPVEEEDVEQEEEDVEMRDVEEDEPSEILDPDDSVRQAWHPQPPHNFRARHDTSSLESLARELFPCVSLESRMRRF